jgi:uncharacterized damage-inducible protein DinB
MTTEQRRFAALEESRDRLLHLVEGVEHGPLNRRPGPRRWSILQVLSHVIQSEELTLSYLQHKLQDPTRMPRAGLASYRRLLTLVVALRSPLRFKAPGATGNVPESGTLAETLQRWENVRSGLAVLVATFPAELRDRAVFRHPFVGRMRLTHTLSFMKEHVEHHARQIAHIKREIG